MKTKRPNIEDYTFNKKTDRWYKDNGEDYDNDLQNYIDLLEAKLSQRSTEQPTRELSEKEIDDQKKGGIYKGYTKKQLINVIITYQNHINKPVEKMSAEEWLLKNKDPSLSRLKKILILIQ